MRAADPIAPRRSSSRRPRRCARGRVDTVAAHRAGARPGPTLSVSTVLSGLHRPWDLAFTPGGGMLFTEKGGADPVPHHRTARSSARSPIPVDSIVMGEGGMMGVAVDPGFTSNRRVYTCFLSNRSGALDVRVVRWRMNEAVTALTDRADIVTGIPVSTGRHSGCRPRFGPDGRLWIGTGDAAMPTVPAEPHVAGRQGAPGRHQRQRRARERARPVRPADLHLRAPQRAGHRVQPGRPGLLDRARHRTATTR